MNCPLCSRVLEPAVLRKENLWCSVDAVEFLPDGKTPAPVASPPDTFAQTAAAIVEKGPAVAKIIDASKKTFHITVGEVSFDATGRVDLTIGTTKVSIT